MIHVHIAGELIKDPASGKPFTVLVLKASKTDGSQVVTALCFGPAHEEAQTMAKGDSVSLVSSATIGLYDRGGDTRPSLSVMTSALLSGRKPKRQRAAKAATSSGDQVPEDAGDLDAVPF